MTELSALSPCAGLLPVSVGSCRLEEIDLGRMTSVSPFRGQLAAASSALRSAYGLAFPQPNQAARTNDAHVIWFGRDTALLLGPEPADGIKKVAALTDQSDAWATVVLKGSDGDQVLARRVPVDLRPAHFKAGETRRTLFGHMNASITRLADDAILILVFRSMAQTLVEEMQEAMEAVAARG
ncbi:MAG: sarcosine oxidase subunit gamma [Pseudomonadota bacterium]